MAIIGAAATGKSFSGKTLAYRACEYGYRSKVVSFLALMRELSHLYKTDPVKYEKRLRYYSKIPLLLIDEWLCKQAEKNWITIRLELMELRDDETSTIICSQLPPENWPAVLGNVALGQAILGRFQASSYLIFLDGPDMRKQYSAKP